MTVDTNSLQLGARPITGRVGAVIDGVDLCSGLTEEMVDDLKHLLAERGVVVFTNQSLDPDGHRAFAGQLGQIRLPPDYFTTLAEQGHPEIGVLVSHPGRGNGADTWHADVTWSPNPPRYSILHMQVMPDAGGDTMWASLTEGYRRLSAPMRGFLEQLTAEHGLPDRSAVHPVVHRHPLTGRLALSVNPTFTQRIRELDDAESAAVLDLLYKQILKPESICRWHWRAGDIGIWDNHFVLHYAINDYGDAFRRIHRIEIEGEPLIPAC